MEQGIGQHVCESAKLDANAFPAILEIFNRLRPGGNGYCLCAHDNWVGKICVEDSIPHTYDPIRAKRDSAMAMCIEHLMEQLTLAANGLRAIQEHVSLQAEKCKHRALSFRMRAGISSLPDEILAYILQCATYDNASAAREDSDIGRLVERTYAAVRNISLTCRRFRYLLAHKSSIPQTIWSGMDSNVVSSLCDRLTRPSAEVIFQTPSLKTITDIHQFFNSVVPRSRYWRQFLQLDCHSRSASPFPLAAYEVYSVAREASYVDAPYLTHLTIKYPPSTLAQMVQEDAPLHYFSTWNLPRLTHFVLCNLAPRPFMTFPPSLTSFTIELDWRGPGLHTERHSHGLMALVNFLASCLNLKEFKMVIYDLRPTTHSYTARHLVILPSVETLKLDFFGCEAPLAKVFFDTVRFPNTLSLDFGMEKFKNQMTSAQYLLSAVLPNSNPPTFLHLKRLRFNFRGECYPRPDFLHIPFSSLTAVEDLTLETHAGDFRFPIGEGPCLPSLRSLTFVDCYCLDKSFVCALLRRLSAQGNVPQLTVTNCQWGDQSHSTAHIDEEEDSSPGDSDDENHDSDSEDEGSEDSENSEWVTPGAKSLGEGAAAGGNDNNEESESITPEEMIALMW